MPYGTSEIDASFYRLIHELVGSQFKDEPAERRGAVRFPFPVIQRVAPRRGGGFPKDHEFIDVRCHDLTGAGFSFFLPGRPDFTSLVAAFGSPPEVIYVAAEVLHCDSVLVYPSGTVEHAGDQAGHAGCQDPEHQAASPMVLVGCRFIERLEKPSTGDRDCGAELGQQPGSFQRS